MKNRERNDEKGLRDRMSFERGVTCPGLFSRVANCTIWGKEWRLSPDCSAEQIHECVDVELRPTLANSWMQRSCRKFEESSLWILYTFFPILFYVKIWGKQRIDVKSASYPEFSLTTKQNSNQQLVDTVVEESPLSLISETKWSNVDTSQVSPVFFE